ncbi:MAG TPA: glycosyltransferase family 39 protein [Thermoanaerobaculia bacterium]|nr:glycosyltransferase family 39 protein [Thermoanaerobaculia bacterium]
MTLSTDAPVRRVSSPAALAGLTLVGIVRALTLPGSLWEMDEVLFARAVERFDPLSYRPHPPGYPLVVGLGKALNLIFHEPFLSLVALSLISTLVGYWAMVVAFRRIAGGPDADRIAVAGAVLFQLSPAMLVQGPLPMSDPPALMFLALALAAGAILKDGGGVWSALGLGAAASAAIGCRPQLAVVVLPLLAVALWQTRGWRRRGQVVAAFTLVSLLWFVPLLVATGGFHSLLVYQSRQAAYVAAHDATASRGSSSLPHLAKRFITHPWGRKEMAIPVLALAVAGIVDLVRRRRSVALPLAVLSAGQLALCLLSMDPADAVRYALPAVLGVAFLAAVGAQWLARLARMPVAAWLAPLLIAAAGLVYTWPVLAVRSRTLSPLISAVRWARRNLPESSIILAGEDMEPQADLLLRKGFDLNPIEKGFYHAAARPAVPAWMVAEGESLWPGTVTFRWPESDAYHKLTRDHYRVVSLSPIPIERRFESLRGVHGWEPTLLDARWRWLDADAAIRIYPRRIVRAVGVRLALSPSAPIPSNTVTVAIEGGPSQTVEVARGTVRRVELPLSDHRPVTIAIRSARAWVPGRGDDRRLAVQLLAVERIAR